MTQAATEQAREQETVVFYSWLGSDEKGRKIPSSQVIYLGGGQKRVANDGQTVQTPLCEAKFHNGVFQTSDPEKIAGVRLYIKKYPGSGVTENREEYYAATMTDEQKVRRANALAGDMDQAINQQAQEIDRLKGLLEKKGAEENDLPKRGKANS
jgi:hypothetical protein